MPLAGGVWRTAHKEAIPLPRCLQSAVGLCVTDIRHRTPLLFFRLTPAVWGVNKLRSHRKGH